MENNYKVVYDGSLKAGTDAEYFVRRFMEVFKVSEAHARQLVTVGRPVTLKTRLDKPRAERLRDAMASIGMQVRVEPMGAESGAGAPRQGEEAGAQAPRCPKCGSTRVQGDDCLACGVIISRYVEKQARVAAEKPAEANPNPYATPQSDVSPVHEGDASVLSGPHTVPVANGWRWIAEGWGYMRRDLGAWIGAFVVWLVMVIIMSIIPFLGSLVLNILAPVFWAGFMLGANEQREGGNFRVRHLFAGFSNNTGSLALVGLLYLVGMLGIVMIVGMVFGGAVFAMGLRDPGALGATLAIAVLMMLALWIPVLMAYWFAPALVVLEGFSPFDAIKSSFMACLKNFLPFLVCGLVSLVLLIVALIPFGLGLLVVMPLTIFASGYAAYRDIYYKPEAAG